MATTTTKKAEFKVNSVSIESVKDVQSLVIRFTSDGVDKTKTMPFTKEWLLVLNDIKDFIENDDDFSVNDVWKYIKEWGIFYWLVEDLAEKKKRLEAKFSAIRAKAGLNTAGSNPIDNV